MTQVADKSTLSDFAQAQNLTQNDYLILDNDTRIAVPKIIEFLNEELTFPSTPPPVQEVDFAVPREVMTFAASMSPRLGIADAVYEVTLTGNGVFALPSIPNDKRWSSAIITLDVIQDATGNRTLTIQNLTSWAHENPYLAATPDALEVYKAANSLSTYVFRIVNNAWRGTYFRYYNI